MVTFQFTITDELGLHARPAGILVKEAKAYASTIQITCGTKSADATRLLAVMGMGVKCGDKVTVKVEGSDEVEAARKFEAFFKENL